MSLYSSVHNNECVAKYEENSHHVFHVQLIY